VRVNRRFLSGAPDLAHVAFTPDAGKAPPLAALR
jgi:hypothetical protein